MFIHLHLPFEIYRYLRVIQLKSSSKLACNANRPWHDEAGTIKIDRDIRDEAGRAHIWVVSYLFQHSPNTNKNQNFVGAIPDFPTPPLPNFWNICFADCHSWRLAQDFQHCLCDCQVRQQEGFPGGSPVSYYTNNVFLKKNTIWYMAIWHIMCKYAQYQPFKQLLGFLLNMWLLQSFTRRNSACLQKLPKNYHITTYDPGITHHMGKHYCSVQALPSSIQCMQLCGNENTQQQFMQWT